jgi:hypothetical protein
MFKSVIVSKSPGFEFCNEVFECDRCHANALPADYVVIHIAIGLNGFGLKVELLKKCKECYKFKKEKGSQRIKDFFISANDNIIL